MDINLSLSTSKMMSCSTSPTSKHCYGWMWQKGHLLKQCQFCCFTAKPDPVIDREQLLNLKAGILEIRIGFEEALIQTSYPPAREKYERWIQDEQTKIGHIKELLADAIPKLPDIYAGGSGHIEDKSPALLPPDPPAIIPDIEMSPPAPPKRKSRRSRGEGTGWISQRWVTRGNNQYLQYFYNWEQWDGGERIKRRSRYIPIAKLDYVKMMNESHAKVSEILNALSK